MELEEHIITFEKKVDNFIEEFVQLKNEIVRIFEMNKREGENASSTKESGLKKLAIGSVLFVTGASLTVVTMGVAPAVMGLAAATAATAGIGAGITGTAVGFINATTGAADAISGTMSQKQILEKSFYDKMEASRKIRRIQIVIEDERKKFIKVLELTKKEFVDCIEKLERLTHKPNIAGKMNYAMLNLNVLINEIDGCFNRIQSENGMAIYDEIDIGFMKVAEHLKNTKKKLSEMQNHDETLKIVFDLLSLIESSIFLLGSQIKMITQILKCGTEIEKFNKTDPCVSSINIIVDDLRYLKTHLENLRVPLKKLEELKDSYDQREMQHDNELRERDIEIIRLKTLLGQLRQPQ